ncbi:MAG: aminotransferase class V-fold PLP-dependent enzyme [Lautropia sp.]
MPVSAEDCARLDAADAAMGTFARLRACFAPGEADTRYFDANSIGPMPADVPARMAELLDAGWRRARRRGWTEMDWLAQPRALGASLAPILGAAAEDVVVGESTSVNQYRMLRLGLRLKAPRRTLVLERDVFPTNRYVAQGIAQSGDAALRLLSRVDEPTLAQALAPGDVAVVALSLVDYRSSERHDIARITAQVQDAGAMVLWDLSHAAGAVSVGLRAAGADMALGCGYKYLCGGPGAPGFVYLHPRWQEDAPSSICGWMGHADPFVFEPEFRPAPGMARWLVGTPSVLANAAFSAAASIWRDVDVAWLDARHRSLTDALIRLLETQCAGFGLALASPRRHSQRGGHVAVRFAHAAALAQALGERGVVVSARKPDALRFGVHPLVHSHTDLWHAVAILRDLLEAETWRDPRFQGSAI